ncbi:hypothetical protein Tco_0474230 [Tanacetum coccineum]
MGLPATHPDEGISITKHLPEGTNTEPKDSGRLKPLTDRDSTTLFVTALLGTAAEYQVDKTQSTRFEVSDLDQHQSKTSSKVELDSEPLVIATVVDIQALLGASNDELKEDNDDDVFEARKDMDEDIQEPETKET